MKEIAAIWEDISLLVPWDENPRYNKAAIESVKKSIERYGFGAPIIARTADRMVIAGHTRLAAAKRLGLDKVPVRYLDLDPADAKMLALADNKLSEIAEWNEDVLQDVLEELRAEGKDVDDLGFVFDEEDLEEFELDEDLTAEVMPEVKFSEYLDEMNNYIVLIFDNEMDWLAAKTHFKLETKHSRRSNGQAWATGIGRVLNGAEYIDAITADQLNGVK